MKIMIAGGGTGGHLFPALAVAEAFKDREPANGILFVGSRRGLEARIVEREGYALRTIRAASLKGKSFLGKLGSLMAMPQSLLQAGNLLRSFKPDIVLGVGGYASGPVVLTAWAMGYPTAIHEQNVFPGLSNRILGRFVDRIYISFADSARHFPGGKTLLTGNPVRKKIRPRRSGTGFKPQDKFTLFIFGGSQGAHPLNQAMQEALTDLREWKERMRFIHQTGEKDYGQVQEAYRREGFEAEVHPFLQDMDRAYGEADLVLCRAGATTLFELMATGLPAILVPYPYAANQHQTLNAQSMVKAGAAVLVADGDLNGAHLTRVLKEWMQDLPRLRKMGERAASLATPGAAKEIVTSCYELAGHG